MQLLKPILAVSLILIACSSKSEPPKELADRSIWYFEKGVSLVEANTGDCAAIDKHSTQFLKENHADIQEIREWRTQQDEAAQVAWGLKNLEAVTSLAARLKIAAGSCDVRKIKGMFRPKKITEPDYTEMLPTDTPTQSPKGRTQTTGTQTTETHTTETQTTGTQTTGTQTTGTQTTGTQTTETHTTETQTTGTANAADNATGQVKILGTKTTFSQTKTGVEMSLAIELKTLGAMPAMPPHLDVVTTCDGRVSDDRAFFTSLRNVPMGAIKQDIVKPFFADRIPAFTQCEYRMQLSDALAPTYFCYREQQTKEGRCSEHNPTSATEPTPTADSSTPTTQVPSTDTSSDITGLVKILGMTTTFGRTRTGSEMSLAIELKTLGTMPSMPPHLDVVTTCDGRVSDDRAFFSSLRDVPVGAVKQDIVKPFFADRIPAFTECEYRMQLSDALAPAYYCYRDKQTKSGRCSEQKAPTKTKK